MVSYVDRVLKVFRGIAILAAAGSLLEGIVIRDDPMLPPAQYPRILARELRHYESRDVEISATPVSVWNRLSGRLEMELQEGDVSLQAVTSGIYPLMFDFKRKNEVEPKKIEDVYRRIKERIQAGEAKPITLRGRLKNEVLQVYGMNIDGIDYYLLQHK